MRYPIKDHMGDLNFQFAIRPVNILDVAVICPLVTDVESGGDGAAVRVPPDRRLKYTPIRGQY